MKPEESLRHMKAAQLMLLGRDNQAISDLYYALQTGIDAIEEKFDGGNAESWIPIKMRPGTDEEYENFCKYGDCPREDLRVFDSPMPDNEQEVLITTRWGNVCVDTWYADVDGCFFEYNSDDDDVIAWMPIPEAYKPEVQDD